MATAKFYLDNRQNKQNTPAPLKIAIRNNNTTAYFSVGISLMENQWDSKTQKVRNTHPGYKDLNAYLSRRKGEVDVELLALADAGGIKRMSAIEIRDTILRKINPEDYSENIRSFDSVMQQFMNLKTPSTKGVYEQTWSRLRAFVGTKELMFSDITIDWLKRFEAFLAKTATKNARNIHLRNIRAIFNYALDNEYTTLYPFRRFKIYAEETRKRSLSVDELREVFTCEVEPYMEFYRDMFKLIFMLIGINTVDLHRLTKITKDGRVEYRRAKTHRLYSIKVEPEALDIIERHKGKNSLLSIADRWSDHRNFRKQINKALQRIGKMERVGRGGKKVFTPLFPELTTYWARHTWSTIAADLDIPDAVISQALGHASANSTTEIYIKRNMKKIDEANRKVLDWVLYGKR